jgi:hypothetical protein
LERLFDFPPDPDLLRDGLDRVDDPPDRLGADRVPVERDGAGRDGDGLRTVLGVGRDGEVVRAVGLGRVVRCEVAPVVGLGRVVRDEVGPAELRAFVPGVAPDPPSRFRSVVRLPEPPLVPGLLRSVCLRSVVRCREGAVPGRGEVRCPVRGCAFDRESLPEVVRWLRRVDRCSRDDVVGCRRTVVEPSSRVDRGLAILR